MTNCSNNYGPYQFPEKLIPLDDPQRPEGKPLPVYGDGLNVRDWILTSSTTAGPCFSPRAGRPGEKYNIGADSERTNLQVLAEILSAVEALRPVAKNPALQSKGLSSYEALKTFVKDRPGHDRRYAIDSSKVRGELGWRPRFDFKGASNRRSAGTSTTSRGARRSSRGGTVGSGSACLGSNLEFVHRADAQPRNARIQGLTPLQYGRTSHAAGGSRPPAPRAAS